MSAIYLKNQTGKRSGKYVRFEYGEDLFGFLFLDVVRGKKHVARRTRTHIFTKVRDFVCFLDMELERNESLNYIPENMLH